MAEKSSRRKTRAFHSNDRRLRAAGFVIVSRPNAAPPVWARGGQLYDERDALAVCARREQEAPAP